MDCLEKWFNIASDPNTPFIIDKQGRKYWLSWHDRRTASSLRAYRYRKPIGRIDVLWNVDYAVLAFIKVNDPKLRGCGIGSAILRELITKTRQRGVKIIVGQIIVPEAIRAQGITEAFLREWYQRQGFDVSLEGGLRMIL